MRNEGTSRVVQGDFALEELGKLSGMSERNGESSLGNQNSLGEMDLPGMRMLARVTMAWPVPSAGGTGRPLLHMGCAVGQPRCLL